MWLIDLLFGRKKKPLKLGLALGSGGAKGFAELGALKAFEENGIEFDCVAGTSIGSIVGAFYADGYSATDIYELIVRINPMEIINSPVKNGIGMDMSKMQNVIDREMGGKNIQDLKKPFVCVATELESGNEHVFDKGSVAQALCASGCMPPFFKPMVIDNVRYVDGAFTNSVPADCVRKMGADYVVGIDLSNHQAKPNLLSRIFPTYRSKVNEPWAKGYANSNVMLCPDLKDYKSTSFFRASEMFDQGYKTAQEFMPSIKKEIEQLKKSCKKR